MVSIACLPELLKMGGWFPQGGQLNFRNFHTKLSPILEVPVPEMACTGTNSHFSNTSQHQGLSNSVKATMGWHSLSNFFFSNLGLCLPHAGELSAIIPETPALRLSPCCLCPSCRFLLLQGWDPGVPSQHGPTRSWH